MVKKCPIGTSSAAEFAPPCAFSGSAWCGYERLGTPTGGDSRMLSSVLSAIELALSSPPLRFDPPGLASTTCDRITSSTTCHNETHTTPHGKDSDASKIGECVLDDSKKECSDGCCCVTSGDGDSENCHDYNLDNYSLLLEGQRQWNREALARVQSV